MGLVAYLLLSFLSAEARTCRLPDLPVHDQDGIGSCYANTASLMMQHNLRLPQAPSYFQMSITSSASRGSFMYRDRQGKSDVFNNGGWVCNTAKSAVDDGFCDSDKFQWDAVGREDPQQKQEAFLKSLGTFLDANRGPLQDLAKLSTRRDEKRRLELTLAGLFQRNAQRCHGTNADYVADRFFERLKKKWSSRLEKMKPGPERTALSAMYARTFTATGLPTPEARNYLQNDFFPRSEPDPIMLLSNPSKEQLQSMRYLPENLFERWWWNRLRIPGKFTPFAYEGYEYLQDMKARLSCSGDPKRDVLEQYLAGCAPSPGALAPAHEQMARELIEGIQRASASGERGLRGLVDLIAPQCADQMKERQGSVRGRCEDGTIDDDLSEVAAAEDIENEICRGKAVGISFCTGFFKSAAPVDTQNCKVEVAGVEKHGRHAVALVGTKLAPNGERMFLIQNSWGQSCPFQQNANAAVSKDLAGLVECEFNGTRPSGRFWVNEKLLLNNSYQYHKLN